ncbi:MAG: hypothetical protein ACREYC_28235 [Gammaproteobacteria bacterium]
MTTSPLLLVLLGSLLGAAGQVLLKLAATGATSLSDFANVRIAAGFLIYGIGSILWVMALSQLPLSRVYPFTVLTFLVVYVASIALLGGARLGSRNVRGGPDRDWSHRNISRVDRGKKAHMFLRSLRRLAAVCVALFGAVTVAIQAVVLVDLRTFEYVLLAQMLGGRGLALAIALNLGIALLVLSSVALLRGKRRPFPWTTGAAITHRSRPMKEN